MPGPFASSAPGGAAGFGFVPRDLSFPHDGVTGGTARSDPDHAGLVVEAMAEHRDVAFGLSAQVAQIEIETFRFTRHDLIGGRVLDVSRDAVAERSDPAKPRGSDRDKGNGDGGDEQAGSAGYVAHVALERTSMLTEGGPVELGPVMSVTAEIKTGQQRVIDCKMSAGDFKGEMNIISPN